MTTHHSLWLDEPPSNVSPTHMARVTHTHSVSLPRPFGVSSFIELKIDVGLFTGKKIDVGFWGVFRGYFCGGVWLFEKEKLHAGDVKQQKIVSILLYLYFLTRVLRLESYWGESWKGKVGRRWKGQYRWEQRNLANKSQRLQLHLEIASLPLPIFISTGRQSLS